MSEIISKPQPIKKIKKSNKETMYYKIGIACLLGVFTYYGTSQLATFKGVTRQLNEGRVALESYKAMPHTEQAYINESYQAAIQQMPWYGHSVELVKGIVALFENHKGTMISLQEGTVEKVLEDDSYTFYLATYEVLYEVANENVLEEVLDTLVQTPDLAIHWADKKVQDENILLTIALGAYGYVQK